MKAEFEKHFKEKGFTQLTAIQIAVAEPLAAGNSVMGIAPTGSGKTLAFTWPLLSQLSPGGGSQLLVLEPSQELAMQTTRVMREWAALVGLHVQSLTGGANVRRQIEKLRDHSEVLVGTPGRIYDLLNRHHLSLGVISSIVIDEADDLLNDHSKVVVVNLVKAAPRDCQLSFFSATTGQGRTDLTATFQRKLVVCDVRKTDNSRGVVQHYTVMARTNAQKTAVLKRLSEQAGFYGLVFFNSQRTLEYVYNRLTHHHFAVVTLGGRQRQVQRQAALRRFKKHQVKLLLTTDVAARGLDIAKLPAVVNFDLPINADQYIHRVGRTGRQGQPGTVYNLGDDHDFRDLKKVLAKTDYQLKKWCLPEERSTVVYQQREEQPQHSATTKKREKVVKSVASPKKRKKHKKNRHRKNKRMRFKRRRKAAEARQKR
ncbi:DEAD/DEAH box helicase [uncultured Limosilactobacillus sp.]|uniref:DEAD/DEAH box helicase n=1 Tax=uncultured Limosilactobacillus sp. TaxID=2837629 RepID=UPI0025CE1916|nr:DEAD/DEAH box helicase [uncultured Limosilactobacillus sp.]